MSKNKLLGLPARDSGFMAYISSRCASQSLTRSMSSEPLGTLGIPERCDSTWPIVIAPSIYYGPSSYGVAGPEKGTIHVNVDHFEKHAYDVLKGFLHNGWRNIDINPLINGADRNLRQH